MEAITVKVELSIDKPVNEVLEFKDINGHGWEAFYSDSRRNEGGCRGRPFSLLCGAHSDRMARRLLTEWNRIKTVGPTVPSTKSGRHTHGWEPNGTESDGAEHRREFTGDSSG